MGVIDIKGLSVNYDKTEALSQVNLEVFKNEFIGIIGPNGGGKTTLIKAILGIVEPSQGTITIEEGTVIGYVPQRTTFDYNFPITVKEVIMTGHLPKKFKFGLNFSSHEKNHTESIMIRLGIETLKNRQIGELSGGQMQRVLIARALMNHPTLLILDEPTAGVDQHSKEEIYKLLDELSNEMTVLMITHNSSEVIGLIDRMAYISQTIHIHETKTDEKTAESCPIDWFIEGERIQADLMADEVVK